MNEIDTKTGLINWNKFWINHPLKNYLRNKNILWANMRLSDYDYSKVIKEIHQSINFEEDDYVLDVGCGTGELLPLIPVNAVVGSDNSETMVQIARTKHMNDSHINIVHAPAHSLPFVDESFDKIICNGVIQYIPYDFFEQSLNEMLRVLKKGGKLFIGDILEKADPESQVYAYPKQSWKHFGNSVKFTRSNFEDRLNVIIEKQ